MAEQWGTTTLDSGSEVMPVGLSENPAGVPFQCGTCEYYGKDVQPDQCGNRHPKLYGRHVETAWCCNLFDRDDMKVIIRG